MLYNFKKYTIYDFLLVKPIGFSQNLPNTLSLILE